MFDFGISFLLTWLEIYDLTDIITQGAVPTQASNLARPAINTPTGAWIKITETKLYAPLVSLSTEDNNKLLEQLKQELK